MIGGTVARLAIAGGYDVVMSNSRGPETLADTVAALGPHARAATGADAAAAGDLVVVSTPLAAIDRLPADQLAGKPVLDTINYYAQRDGNEPSSTPARPPAASFFSGGFRVRKSSRCSTTSTSCTSARWPGRPAHRIGPRCRSPAMTLARRPRSPRSSTPSATTRSTPDRCRRPHVPGRLGPGVRSAVWTVRQSGRHAGRRDNDPRRTRRRLMTACVIATPARRYGE